MSEKEKTRLKMILYTIQYDPRADPGSVNYEMVPQEPFYTELPELEAAGQKLGAINLGPDDEEEVLHWIMSNKQSNGKMAYTWIEVPAE